MPKIVDQEQEQKNIILAFQRCCLVRPMASVTVREIAKEAGISHAKIFSYFSNKKEIIISYAKYIADVYSKAFEEIIMKVARKKAGEKELLKSLVNELYEIDRDNTVEKLYAQVYIFGQYDEEIRTVVLNAYSDWRQSIKKMLANYDVLTAENVARSVLVLLEGVLIYRMNDELSRDEAIQIIPHLFIENSHTRSS